MDEEATREFVSEELEKLRGLDRSLGIHSIKQENLDTFVEFLRRKDGKIYMVRFRCNQGFPIESCASVHFVNPQTLKDEGPDFWPDDGERAVKRTHNPPFICLPGVREYHQPPGNHGGKPTRAVLSLASIFTSLLIHLNK